MKINVYRLEDRKIIESVTGELMWETHTGFGELQEGRCFRKGEILFIGPVENGRPGFLRGEFLDDLKRFPEWLKTKYYCKSLEIYHCQTGKRVAKEEMLLWSLQRGIDEGYGSYSEKSEYHSDDIFTGKTTEDVGCILQRYEIIKKTNGQIIWKKYAGKNTVASGVCWILEDILFIGSRQNEKPTFSQRQRVENLQLLPKWDQTKYYCPKLSLHDCKTGNRAQQERKRRPGEKRVTEKNDIRNGYRNNAEGKIPNPTQREISSEKIWPIFDSFAGLAARLGEHGRFFRSKFKMSYVPKSIAIFRASNIRKWVSYAVALAFLITSLLFVFCIDYWKELYDRRHAKKGGHSSTHRRNH